MRSSAEPWRSCACKFVDGIFEKNRFYKKEHEQSEFSQEMRRAKAKVSAIENINHKQIHA